MFVAYDSVGPLPLQQDEVCEYLCCQLFATTFYFIITSNGCLYYYVTAKKNFLVWSPERNLFPTFSNIRVTRNGVLKYSEHSLYLPWSL